jgi:hypothetical protein
MGLEKVEGKEMTIRGTVAILFLVLMLFVVSAYAADIAAADVEGAKVTLTNERVGCDFAEGAMRVRVRDRDGTVYMGCYLVKDGWVWIKYDDGDIGRIPTNMFSPTT